MAQSAAINAPFLWRTRPKRGKDMTSHDSSSTRKMTSSAGYDVTPLSHDRIEALAEHLTEEQARVLLRRGTEPPFCGDLLENKLQGIYVCRL